MEYVNSLLKGLDIYGQSIHFSYKNSRYFSTLLGLVISIIIFILIILYFLANLFLTIGRSHPRIVKNVETKYNENIPSHTILNDYPGLFSIKSQYVELSPNQLNNTLLTQISFGFYENEEGNYQAIDLKYFYVKLESREPGVNNKPLYYDNCRRFYKNNDRFNSYLLNRTYCVYSQFDIQGDYLNPTTKSSNLVFEVNKCINNTHYSLPKSYHPDYIYLYLSFLKNEVEAYKSDSNFCTTKEACWKKFKLKNPTSCVGITDNTSNKRLLEEVNEKKEQIDELLNKFENKLESYEIEEEKHYRNLVQSYSPIDLSFIQSNKIAFSLNQANCFLEEYLILLKAFNSRLSENKDADPVLPNSKSKSQNAYLTAVNQIIGARRLQEQITGTQILPIVCADPESINKKLKNLDLVVHLSDKSINATSTNNPISDFIRKDVYYSSDYKTNVFYTMTTSKIKTYENLLPKFVLTDVQLLYTLEVSNIATTLEEKNETGEIFLVSISLNSDVITYERSYWDILDIAGLVGGLSAVLIAIGFIIVKYYRDFRYNESIMNEFYSIIDPENMKNTDNDFENYINKLYNKYKNVDPETKGNNDSKENNLLENFFTPENIVKIKSFQEKLIAYEEAKKKLEQKKKDEVHDEILGVKKKALNKIRKDKNKIASNDDINKVDKNSNDINFDDLSYDFDVDSSKSDVDESNNIKNKDLVDNGRKKGLLKVLSKQEKQENDNSKNSDNTSEIELDENDLSKRMYLKYKIIFEVFKHQVNAGMKFTNFEVLLYNLFRCCICGKLKRKFVTYEKGVKLVKKDTDYVSLIRSVQDFELIKKSLLEKEQLDLFSSFSKETIILNNQGLDDSNTRKIRKKTIVKDYKEDGNQNTQVSCLQQKMKKFDETLINLANSDRDDDSVDEKLLNQLHVDKKIISEFLDEINIAKTKKKQVKLNQSVLEDNKEPEINNSLSEDIVRQMANMFPPKY